MKNYKDLVSEVAQPKAPEEKRFKDQHTIEVIPHPVAPDHVFTGEIPGLTDGKRLADVDNAEADYDKAYKSKVDQTLPQRGTGQGKPVAEDSNIVKKSITEILGVNKKKKDDKKDDESMEEKVTCPKCEGKGCDHCDGNGYHIKEGGCSGDTLKAEKKPVKKAETKEDKVDAGGNKDSLEPEAKPIKKPKVAPTSVSIKDSNGKTISLTFKEMLDKVSTEEELLESPQQEVPMMMKQLNFICYASQEIEEYLGEGQDPEEWWQNKLAEVFSNVKSLYAYAKGDSLVNGRPLGAAKILTRAGYGESIEAGTFELDNKTSIDISEDEANLLNKMFEELTETNSKDMYGVMVADEAGFNEILEFAKENLS
jgi:predicted RecA/RadA family phage recombinase